MLRPSDLVPGEFEVGLQIIDRALYIGDTEDKQHKFRVYNPASMFFAIGTPTVLNGTVYIVTDISHLSDADIDKSDITVKPYTR